MDPTWIGNNPYLTLFWTFFTIRFYPNKLHDAFKDLKLKAFDYLIDLTSYTPIIDVQTFLFAMSPMIVMQPKHKKSVDNLKHDRYIYIRTHAPPFWNSHLAVAHLTRELGVWIWIPIAGKKKKKGSLNYE